MSLGGTVQRINEKIASSYCCVLIEVVESTKKYFNTWCETCKYVAKLLPQKTRVEAF